MDREICTLLDAPANYAKLRAIAGVLSIGLVGVNGDDLISEAVVRFYEGRRKWPAGVHPLVVFKMAMHRIASDARKRAAEGPIDESVGLAVSDIDGDTDLRPKVHGVAALTPEDHLSGRQQLVGAYAAVAGDEDLELLVMVWADGLRGDDAARELNWDKKKYEAARKRLTRRLGTLNSGPGPK